MRCFFVFFVFFISLIVFSCKEKQDESFYEIIPINDITSKIVWGNSKFQNSQIFEKKFLDKSYLFSEGKNQDFIVIQRAIKKYQNVGLVMPLKKNSKIKEFKNIINFEQDNNILVVQKPMKNKMLFCLKNLNNNKELIVGNDLPICESTNSAMECFSFAGTGSYGSNKFYIRWGQGIPGEYVKYGYDISSLMN